MLQVVAAVIKQANQFLITQRPLHALFAGKWEFPGGKIQINESHEEALVRELSEELGVLISVQSLFMTVQHQYTDFELMLHVYLGSIEAGKVAANEGQNYQWVEAERLEDFEFTEADQPIVNRLVQEFFQ